MIKLAICDDENFYLERLKSLTHKAFTEHGQNININLFDNGRSLLDELEKNLKRFDIIFLDVDMPELSGFQIAKRIQEIDAACLLVFVTNMEQHACEGYKYSAFRYIYKSNLSTEIPNMVSAALEKLKFIENENMPLIFKYRDAGGFEVLEISASDILYLKIEKTRRVTMRTIYSEYDLLVKPLSEYQETLDSFVLLTRNYLLNFNHVTDMNNEYFILSNGEKIPLGFAPETKKASKEKYLQYLKGRMQG
jgi:DNA-binding LytR/AlgR family response regulator